MTTARTSARRSVMTAGLVTALALSGGALAGCAPQTSAAPKPRPTSAPPAAAATVATVPGYDVGQFPPVPLFVLPDLSLLDTSASAFTIEVNAALAGIPGVIATPAHCDATGAVTSGNGSAYLYGDGSGAFTGPDGTVQNFGDGSGTSTINGVTIQNFGDGSGNYTDGDLTIQNWGDGTAKVNGEDVEADPLPEVPRLGVFPPLGALAPLESCGTTLTFEDGVLFDFDRSDIRPDAAATLDAVAEVLSTLKVGEAVVSGHTDAIGDDDDNQRLSEDRADAVVDGLTSRDVSTRFTAEGFGESRPVAANEIDGADNPAGRQLNRRVEIFIPAAL